MDIKTELHNLKTMVLNESHISDNVKEKIANRIFEIEKRIDISKLNMCVWDKNKVCNCVNTCSNINIH